MRCSKCKSPVLDNKQFCSKCGNNIQEQKSRNSKIFALISIFGVSLQILFVAYCFIQSWDVDESPYAWMLLFYFMTIALPIMAVNILLSLHSLMLKKNYLSILAVIINSIPLVVFCLFYFYMR